MQTLSEVHPGDSHQELQELATERSSCSGWEAWTRNVQMSVGEGK
jgi:hypothetical protein